MLVTIGTYRVKLVSIKRGVTVYLNLYLPLITVYVRVLNFLK